MTLKSGPNYANPDLFFLLDNQNNEKERMMSVAVGADEVFFDGQ